ncbi:DNA-directed RNA polymerase [Saxophila tyrrhenica]|uniref:DNA-directed RNA polymerase n=1 Tax=Saxophila tyrrhenica TaxID=1690608 RepID=A0AAV9NZD3_9PEZI|nr:DNA-directed RNA polymerase [Saxophila tyrrhenica]
MLVRSAGRRQQRRTAQLLAASFAQLNLPWLAPAQLRWSATHSPASSQPSRPRRRSSSRDRTTTTQSRRLATTTDQQPSRSLPQYPPPGYADPFRNPSHDNHVPWDANEWSKRRLSSIRPYAAPIVLNTNLDYPDETVKILHGVQGTAHDLLQHLHTSLRVRRFSRAEDIIRRLNGIFRPYSAELVHAHTAYLEAWFGELSLHGRSEEADRVLDRMQKWFEVEIQQKGVRLDARLLVAMIRASIKALTGSKRDRTIRRYLDLAQQQGTEVYDEVIDSPEYDDHEFTLLGRVSYEHLQPQEPDMKEAQPQQDEPAPLQRSDAVPMEGVPAVLPTALRGDGLAGVKRALQDFSEIPPLPADATVEQRREHAFARQQAMEESSVQIAMDRWRKADDELRKIGINTSMQSKPINALMWQWYQALLPALEQELEECKKLLSNPGRTDHERYHYGPYLELLPLDKIAANTILYTMTKLAGRDRKNDQYTCEVTLTVLTMGLAKAIEQECSVNSAKQKSLKRKGNKNYHMQKKGNKTKSKAHQEQDDLLASLSWPIEAKAKFGSMLATKLMETAQLPVTRLHPRTGENMTQAQPAFLHRFKWEKGKKIGMLSPNPALTEKLESEPVGSLIAKRMPMVVEPKPWTGWDKGGYLHYATDILRVQKGDRNGKDYFLAAHKRGETTQIYAGLTALGQVPWNINHNVFKVLLEAWNSGEAIANLAPLHPQLDYPPEPEASADPAPRRRWLEEVREVENKRIGLHSERCFQNFQMEVARAMLNETMYFPHNMDFRGRAYPIPPYLNHMGADNVRGLLTFGEGKRLGATGLRWLKIHLATVAGHDKASLSERIEFTMNHLDDIYDSARNPLGGRRWWLQAEDAWQTLAACFELTAALDSPDPEGFISHLPVQQDGTCNGLQHYAALGGDKIGAAQVNLEPGDRPADVYTAVAEAVKADVHQDALDGNAIAKKLDGNITRKCVKQPVMTNVYGVTWYGAKEQVRKQLEVIFPDVRKFDEVNYGNMSTYIATKIFKSLGTMFGGAQAIQHWLGQCADRISTSLTPKQVQELSANSMQPIQKKKPRPGPKKVEVVKDRPHGTGSTEGDRNQQRAAKPMFKSTVVWTSPLRLPVVQPYRADTKLVVRTNLQGLTLQEPRTWHPVSKRKQLQAFPPNFIHSLDATHMLLSALRCKENGMTFASVHDSFWTHACDVDRLGVALRDSFVEMHSENIIGRLKEEFETRYDGYMYLATVLANSKAGKKISQLRKDKKLKSSEELALEAEHTKLLNSDDPAERSKGEAMRTPGSILANEGDDKAFAVPSEIEDHQLGNIPENLDMRPDSEATGLTAEADEGVVGGSALATDTDAIDAEKETAGRKGKAAATVGKSGKPHKQYPRKLFVWMPLTFPDVPPKGEFDVRKIRETSMEVVFGDLEGVHSVVGLY